MYLPAGGKRGALRNCLLAGLTLWLLALLGCAKITVPKGSTVIRNGTVIDVTGKSPVEKALVVIREDKIWAVGREKDYALPKDTTVLDAEGGYILPGFIDAHVHISNAKNLKPWLRAGVTTVRDLGGPAGIVLARKYTPVDQPRLFVSGPIITVPGGYPISALGDKAAKAVKGPRDAALQVGTLIDEGVDVIKIAVTLGMDKEPLPTLSMDEIRAITTTAHQRSKKVTAHVLRANDARRAIEGGVDQLAHIVIDELPQDLIMSMVKRGVIITPTLGVLVEGIAGAEDLKPEQQTEVRENLKYNLSRFVALGGLVALGDDFGVTGVAMDMPVEELSLMVQAGMTPQQVIRAATLNGALALGRETELGSLEKGKSADILVLKANPMQDLANLRQVKGVLFKGVTLSWDGWTIPLTE